MLNKVIVILQQYKSNIPFIYCHKSKSVHILGEKYRGIFNFTLIV